MFILHLQKIRKVGAIDGKNQVGSLVNTVQRVSRAMRVNDRYDIEKTGRASRRGSTVGVEIDHDTIYMVRLGGGADGDISCERFRKFKYDPRLDLGSEEFVAALKAALH